MFLGLLYNGIELKTIWFEGGQMLGSAVTIVFLVFLLVGWWWGVLTRSEPQKSASNPLPASSRSGKLSAYARTALRR